MLKLNVGSNAETIEGWINIDLYPSPGVIQHDARTKFPYEDNSVDFIFSEHFIEHLTTNEALFYFKECHRMLRPGGVVRTATFNIDDIMYNCIDPYRWSTYKEKVCNGKFSDLTRIQFFNFAVYEGAGHKSMWAPDEMERFLRLAGFDKIRYRDPKDSDYIELQGLEYRDNSTCVVEAIK